MINIPVFSDENGIPQISMYVEDEDGTFRRTQSEPLRLLRDDIKGISISQGDIVSATYDRYEREWNTPTVTFHYGRPQSYYQFIRSKVAHNRFFVFTKPQLSGHISKLTLHELQLKNSTSQRKVAILKEKYIEAVELWSEQELENLKHKKPLSTTYRLVQQERSAVDVKTGFVANYEPKSEYKKDFVRDKSNVTYLHRHKFPEESSRRTQQSPAKTIRTASSDDNAVERDFNKRKNLIQEFSLSKAQPKIHVEQKDHNKHFFRRFLHTLD